jgi:hypothetical protein
MRACVLGVVFALAMAAPSLGAEKVIAFRHVSVLPMDRDIVLSDQAVVVRGNTIIWTGDDAAARIPASAKSIDGRGKYLLPGLVDFHTHPEPSDLPSYTDYGVTTIAALDGEPLRRHAEHNVLPASTPNIISATHIMDGRQPAHWHNYSVGSAADVPAIMDPMIAQGAQMAKIYSLMTRAEMEAIVAHAHARGIPVIGHIPPDLPREYVLGGNGLDMVAHSEELTHYLSDTPTDAEEQALVDLVVRNRVAVTPNLIVIAKLEGQTLHLKEVLADPEIAYLPPNLYQEWLPRNNDFSNRSNPASFVASVRAQLAVQEGLTRKLNDSGALLLAGTDAADTCFPGECLHEEIALLSANGLGNYGALRAATFNAGVFASTQIRAMSTERFGVIAPGTRADLLLVDANPVADLAALKQIDGVMISGRWRARAELDAVRKAELPTITHLHAIVDRYEQLYVAGNIAALTAWLDTLPTLSQWPFSEDIMCQDARILEKAGRGTDGLALLTHVRRLLPQSIGIRNVRGQIALRAKDYVTARAAFAETLAIAPENAVAKKGLADIAAAGG